ncbi:hypothetical protein AB5J52_27390 [Streptomyces sp. R39]|uniref:Uncharacterized protein n=1 Tax=Streptomyces sp. R39 TaxID=3238631 RepID=A0AB39QSQ1_9ACTN
MSRARPGAEGWLDDDRTWSVRYSWVTRSSTEEVAARVQALREGNETMGEPPRPAVAIRVLYAFAIQRSTDQLIEAAAKFHFYDAVNVLATAALWRSIGDAADLVCRQSERDGAAAPGGAGQGERQQPEPEIAEYRPSALSKGIVHDVARQRTALDVARFVRELRGRNKQDLVDATLTTFSEKRTLLDTALLYLGLRDEGCEEAAVDLLGRAVQRINTSGARQSDTTTPAGLNNLVAALRMLSPVEPVLENWIDARLADTDLVGPTRDTVAKLIAGSEHSPDALIEHVGKRLKYHNVAAVCRELAESAPERCEAVQNQAAAREELHELAEIISRWQKFETVAKTRVDLYSKVVARGVACAAGPRSPVEIETLVKELKNIDADPECWRLLWIAAAEHVDGRAGGELVRLQTKIERSRDMYRVARTVARRLTAGLLSGSVDPAVFADYVTAQQVQGNRGRIAADDACKELSDPSDPELAGVPMGGVVAETAVRLYGNGTDRAWGQEKAWDLLERCLENEQRITPADVVVITERLRASRVDGRRQRLLYRGTVGRWADAARREETILLLRGRGFEEEAEQVVESVH